MMNPPSRPAFPQWTLALALGVPVVGAVAAILLAVARGSVSSVSIGLLVAMYVLTAGGIEVGYHRLFTHRSFKARPTGRLLLAIAGAMAAEGRVRFWVATHRSHHRFADSAGDPHSPLPATWRGFWHAHVAWLFRIGEDDAVPADLARDPVVRFVDRNYLAWVLLGLGLPALTGFAFGGAFGALEGFLWGGLLRMALCHQVTWCLNSLAHLVGQRPHETRDHSRNIWWLALPTLGASWHNNHHAMPAYATNDHRWWQIDPSGWFIRTGAWLGIFSGVREAMPNVAPRSKHT